MQRRHVLRGTCVLALLVVLAVVEMLVPSANAQQPARLLSALETPIDPAAVSAPLAPREDLRYTRGRLARFRPDVLAAAAPGEPLLVELFDDTALTVVAERVSANAPGELSYRGWVEGAPLSSVRLEQVGDALVGSIWTADRAWVVRAAGGGAVAVHEVNRAAFALIDDGGLTPPEPRDRPIAAAAAAPRPRAANGATTITYLGLYTQDALRAQGGKAGIKAAIQLTVTALNDAFEAQNVNAQVKLVGVKKVGSSSGTLEPALLALTDPDDGEFDNAHRLRDRKKADVVGMYIEGDGSGFGTCGLAWRPFLVHPGNESHAFATVREDCNVVHGGTVGAHEFLHNASGCHPTWNGAQNCQSPAAKIAHGFVVGNGSAHTLLGTGAVCSSCTRLVTVSGRKRFQGLKVKGPDANMAKFLKSAVGTLAGYR